MTSSEQARADAMADAETLRQIADEMALEHPGPTFKRDYPEAYETVVALDSISGFAASEYRTLPEKAIYSAQDAFRAVPGLRG